MSVTMEFSGKDHLAMLIRQYTYKVTILRFILKFRENRIILQFEQPKVILEIKIMTKVKSPS